MHTFFIAPTGFGVGLTSISLGLLRALERAGLKVGFFKPIAQLHPGDLGPERSSELVARTHGLDTPKPLPLAQVERMLGDGQLDELLEEIISLYQRAAADKADSAGCEQRHDVEPYLHAGVRLADGRAQVARKRVDGMTGSWQRVQKYTVTATTAKPPTNHRHDSASDSIGNRSFIHDPLKSMSAPPTAQTRNDTR